jgi:hypothetical protein
MSFFTTSITHSYSISYAYKLFLSFLLTFPILSCNLYPESERYAMSKFDHRPRFITRYTYRGKPTTYNTLTLTDVHDGLYDIRSIQDNQITTELVYYSSNLHQNIHLIRSNRSNTINALDWSNLKLAYPKGSEDNDFDANVVRARIDLGADNSPILGRNALSKPSIRTPFPIPVPEPEIVIDWDRIFS